MKKREVLEEAIKDTIKGYKEIIFGSDNSIFMACLNELRKQQAIDQHLYDQRLMDDMIRKLAGDGLTDGDMIIDKRTGEVSSPEVDSTYGKDKFYDSFYGIYRP